MTESFINIPGMPPAGANRYWHGKHQPNKKTTPLRLELRQRRNRSSANIVDSFSDLISFEDVIAQPDSIVEGAVKILERAARVDEFVGYLAPADEVAKKREEGAA